MRRFAFTLVELLVVIAIIGILVGLLVPAVQAAREAGRKTQCSNNLNQFTKAALQHDASHGYLPTGGWSGNWSGDPNFGAGQGQPGGWTYNILPFMESQTVHDMGIGLQPSANKTQLGQAAQTLIGGFYCPTRRATALYPISTWTCNSSSPPSGPPLQAMHTDYAANAGTNTSAAAWSSPPTGGDPGAKGIKFPDTSAANGVIFATSMVTNAEIRSGTGNTILFGEKYMDAAHWTDGQDQGDEAQLFAGSDDDWERFGTSAPMRDRSTLANPTSFGSAHADGLNVFMCDGSGHWMNYNIDPTTFANLCNRNNGTPIDNSKLGW